MAAEYWNDIEPISILNCWRKTGILGSEKSMTMTQESDYRPLGKTWRQELDELSDLLSELKTDKQDGLTALEYVQMENLDDGQDQADWEVMDNELLINWNLIDNDEEEENINAESILGYNSSEYWDDYTLQLGLFEEQGQTTPRKMKLLEEVDKHRVWFTISRDECISISV